MDLWFRTHTEQQPIFQDQMCAWHACAQQHSRHIVERGRLAERERERREESLPLGARVC